VAVGNRTRLGSVVKALEREYGLSRHGNLRNAYWELVYIIISTRTAEAVYSPVFRQLKRHYKTLDALAGAKLPLLRGLLKPAGLSRLKARQLTLASQIIQREFSERSLTTFGRRSPAQFEDFLRTLPGVAVKVAKCVSMYACDATSLPVDAHVWRVMSRLGYAPGGRLTEKRALELESKVRPDLRFAVHVLCVSHGRSICRSKPLCSECVVASDCPSAGRI
jgi:endonuclease-3